jgi:hypothetical protein
MQNEKEGGEKVILNSQVCKDLSRNANKSLFLAYNDGGINIAMNVADCPIIK